VALPRGRSGALIKPSLATIKDLDYREIITLGPLVVLTILFGVYPKLVLTYPPSRSRNSSTTTTTPGAAKAAACCTWIAKLTDARNP
jgi:NADH-quinone oxidoreductase subunit M